MHNSGVQQTAAGNEPSHFARLIHKIRRLLEGLQQLRQENEALKIELEKYRNGPDNSLHLTKLDGLESELRLLRKENKSLKEREKLIKHKVERLAVKLNSIDM